jgi:uncharacterized OB-fold protein
VDETETHGINRPTNVPSPVVVPLNERLWRAAAEERLDVQQCSDCGAHRYPPMDGCPRCGSLGSAWATLPGTGTIYTYTWWTDRARSEQAGHDVWSNKVIIELDGAQGGPVRLESNVVDAWEVGDLSVGQRVELVTVPLEEGVALPCFRRSD